MGLIRFATSNVHKLAEAKELLSIAGWELKGIPQELLQSIVEPQSESFSFIAEQKLMNIVSKIKDIVFVEDAGLVIPCLNNFPGPYSSYVLQTIGCNGLLKLLNKSSDRRAYFVAVIALSFNGKIKIIEEKCFGTISNVVKGEKGFGFDPIFIPDNSIHTFAELGSNWKSKYSHRAKAIDKLIQVLEQ